jgi:hypothetical protein
MPPSAEDEAIAALAAARESCDFHALVGTMRSHSALAAVQEWGCSAIANLAVASANVAKALAAGAVEAVVAALRAHPAHAGVQEKGFRGAPPRRRRSGAARAPYAAPRHPAPRQQPRARRPRAPQAPRARARAARA